MTLGLIVAVPLTLLAAGSFLTNLGNNMRKNLSFELKYGNDNNRKAPTTIPDVTTENSKTPKATETGGSEDEGSGGQRKRRELFDIPVHMRFSDDGKSKPNGYIGKKKAVKLFPSENSTDEEAGIGHVHLKHSDGLVRSDARMIRIRPIKNSTSDGNKAEIENSHALSLARKKQLPESLAGTDLLKIVRASNISPTTNKQREINEKEVDERLSTIDGPGKFFQVLLKVRTCIEQQILELRQSQGGQGFLIYRPRVLMSIIGQCRKKHVEEMSLKSNIKFETGPHLQHVEISKNE